MNTAMTLTRSFLATGDRRCPLVCIWTLIPSAPAADDSERTQPARWTRLLWGSLRAGLSRTVMCLRYANFAS